MSNICIIPARGGSKRIHKKNIKLFSGKPIIEYSIKNAINSKLFDKIIVSTDSIEIKNIAVGLGAEVPFLRSKETSSDNASIEEACIDVLDQIKNDFDNVCCLFATSPLLSKQVLINSYNKFILFNYDSLCPIIKYDKPMEKSLKLKNNKVSWFDSDNSKLRTQDLNNLYYDAGQFYFSKTEKLYDNLDFINKNTGFIELNKYDAVDIDNIQDWKFAEKLFKINKI
jgi:pseudaminic acid cytidylyltransferase